MAKILDIFKDDYETSERYETSRIFSDPDQSFDCVR
jgi:hypothetical protein